MFLKLKSILVIVAGFFVGLLLASLDHILPVEHLTGITAWVVVVVDWAAPPVAGVLFAGALLYAQRARKLHEAERAAAEVLAERLAGTERRQAIWVVAAAVAHDLKNPLHNLQLLVEEAGDEQDPALRRELLERIRENVRRATERLSELSRAGQQPEGMLDRRVDLPSALEELRQRLNPTLQATRAVMEIDCPRGLAVRGDAHALRSAVENVAANALEALQEHGGGGRLAVRAERRDGVVELTVQDDGPGISTEVREKLFSPFTSGHGGTGLGLSIARALARAGGGDLVCLDSGSGRTTFRFTFPSA